jgi:hypothetical protein
VRHLVGPYQSIDSFPERVEKKDLERRRCAAVTTPRAARIRREDGGWRYIPAWSEPHAYATGRRILRLELPTLPRLEGDVTRSALINQLKGGAWTRPVIRRSRLNPVVYEMFL